MDGRAGMQPNSLTFDAGSDCLLVNQANRLDYAFSREKRLWQISHKEALRRTTTGNK